MPIGSFDVAWENYDHSSGPALVDEVKALATWQAGDPAPDQPNWRLTFGLGSGMEDWTNRMKSAEVTFSREGDGGIRLAVAGNLRALQYERAPVSFWFGYGDKLVPYFRGRLASPIDSPRGLSGEATAYGLKTELGQRYFAQARDYGGEDLRDAFWDVIDRFGADEDRFFFQGTHSTTLAKNLGRFELETPLSSALETIFEKMQFRMWDNPSGMVIVDRSHLTTLGTDDVFSGAGHYDVEHYPMDGFTFEESMANFYSDVIIYRRNENFQSGGGEGVEGLGPAGVGTDVATDEYAVYVDKATAGDDGVTSSGRFNVQEGRYWIIADYPGQQEHAERERELLVTALNRGVGNFTFTHLPTDFSIGDHFSVTRLEQIHDPEAFGDLSVYHQPQIDAVKYACVAEETTLIVIAKDDAGNEVSTGRWAQTTTGQAFEMERVTVRPSSLSSLSLAVAPGLP